MIGFTGLLTIVFIVLKLTGIISWSWLFVLMPIILSISFFIFIILIAYIAVKVSGR